MNDFFTRLAERTLGLAPTLQPILAPMFAPEIQPMSDEPLETVVSMEAGADDNAGLRSSRSPLTMPKPSPSSSSIEMDDVGVQVSGPLQWEKSAEQTRFPGENASEKSISTSSMISISKKPEPFSGKSMPGMTRSMPPQAAGGARSLMPDRAPQLTAESRFITSEAAVESRSTTPAPKPQSAVESRFSSSETPGQVHLGTLIHETATPTQSGHMQEIIQPPQRVTNRAKTANIPIITTRATVLHTVEQQTEVKQAVQATPTIHVTIGRIEVRATPPTTPTAPSQRQSNGPVVKSLDDYLQQRARGGH